MASSLRIINESFSSVEDTHVVDESNIANLHTRSDLMLTSDEMESVQSFCLCFGKARDAFSALLTRGMSDQEAARVIQDHPVILKVQQCPLIVGRASTVSEKAVSPMFRGLRRDLLTCRKASLAWPGLGSSLVWWLPTHCTLSMLTQGRSCLRMPNSCGSQDRGHHTQYLCEKAGLTLVFADCFLTFTFLPCQHRHGSVLRRSHVS